MTTEASEFLLDNFGRLFDEHGFRISSDVSDGRSGSSTCIARSPSSNLILFVAFDRDRPSLIIGDSRSTPNPQPSYATLREGKWFGLYETRKLLDKCFSIKNSIYEMPSDASSRIQFCDHNYRFIREHVDELINCFENEHVDTTVRKLESYSAEVSEAYDTRAENRK